MSPLFLTIYILALVPYGILSVYIIQALLKSKSKLIIQNVKEQISPPVSIILTCYNEDKYVHQKISSLLDEKNWIKGSEIIVVTGGSTDSTNVELIKFKDHPYVTVHILESRISKIQGVNIGVSKAQHNFLVFSDFRQEMEPGSIFNLLKNFDDPSIGTVSGTLVDTKNISKPSFTRSLLNTIAIKESLNSSSLNVFGALYAQRRECFTHIPEDILFDDLFVTASTLAQNKRLVQEKNAIIYDVNFDQYYRKERIMRLARGLLLFLFNHLELIKKIPLKLRIRFLVFKYLKLTFPISLFLLLISTTGLMMIGEYFLPLMLLSLASVLLIIPFSRKLFIMSILIHYYFAIAIILYLNGNGRSVFWEKLQHVK